MNRGLATSTTIAFSEPCVSQELIFSEENNFLNSAFQRVGLEARIGGGISSGLRKKQFARIFVWIVQIAASADAENVDRMH